MREELLKLLKNSYSPYSNYSVSAAVECKDSQLFYGVNVENASYGATICAERNAILNAITNGYKKGDFKKLYVCVKSEKLAFPCFSCRQVISEFFEMTDELILINETKEERYIMSDILPYPFTEEDLK